MTHEIRSVIPRAWALMDRPATLDNTRSAVWAILKYLEGMEAVTNSQPVAQETTNRCRDCGTALDGWDVIICESCSRKRWPESHTTTDAPAPDCTHPRWKAYDQLSMGVTQALTNAVYRVFLHTCQTEGCKALNIGGTTYLPAGK